ncbi:ATPase WRNIP1 [Xylocopa sonorina]|uniref:ATPase WRNIP1 n=1 Tax=Xylocopa sonorina TaxID=1818115 RepID=UPI00403AB484
MYRIIWIFKTINEINLSKNYNTNTNIINTNQQNTMSNMEHIHLTEKMQPACLDDYIGQELIIGSNTLLQHLLTKGHVPSMILYGPPGCGKTSLANIIAKLSKEIHGDKVHVVKLSASSTGVNSIRDVVNTSKKDSRMNCQTIVFMDEIHRFNKLQQDIFLPHIEAVIDWLAEVCDGDARVALNGLELAVKTKVWDKPSSIHLTSITLEDIKESLKQAHMLSDRQTNNSHHLYSALHKSIKAGKQNASLYWLARIMAIKEDPVNIARRLVRISSEDIGLADIDALGIAVQTMHGCQMIGMPESDVLLAECVVYLTRAPKSQLLYNALKSAENIIRNHKDSQSIVPLHIRERSEQQKLCAVLGMTLTICLFLEIHFWHNTFNNKTHFGTLSCFDSA